MRAATLATDVVIVLRELPEDLRPCYVGRRPGITVLFTDPRSDRLEALEWVIDHLTVEEREHLRAAYGQPPIGQPIADRLVEGRCDYVPAELQAPAIRPQPRWVRLAALAAEGLSQAI